MVTRLNLEDVLASCRPNHLKIRGSTSPGPEAEIPAEKLCIEVKPRLKIVECPAATTCIKVSRELYASQPSSERRCWENGLAKLEKRCISRVDMNGSRIVAARGWISSQDHYVDVSFPHLEQTQNHFKPCLTTRSSSQSVWPHNHAAHRASSSISRVLLLHACPTSSASIWPLKNQLDHRPPNFLPSLNLAAFVQPRFLNPPVIPLRRKCHTLKPGSEFVRNIARSHFWWPSYGHSLTRNSTDALSTPTTSTTSTTRTGRHALHG